jgi:tetratricopeptide (TPR) repeat protein
MQRIFLAVCLALLCGYINCPGDNSAAMAQSFSKRGQKSGAKGKNANRRQEENDIEAPVNLNKFPGVGSIDSWKTSVPEFRAGMSKMKQHSWDEAIAHFRASIALYEYQPHAWYQIGRAIEAKSGLFSDAEKAFRKSVSLDNQYWQGWKALANNLYVQKRYDEAREAVSNALNLDAPQAAKGQMRKIVEMIDSAQRNSNTESQNTAQ